MPFLLAVIIAWAVAISAGGSDDFVCKHQEWTAHHMQEQLGWPLEKGRKSAADQCRRPFIKPEDK